MRTPAKPSVTSIFPDYDGLVAELQGKVVRVQKGKWLRLAKGIPELPMKVCTCKLFEENINAFSAAISGLPQEGA